ITPSAAAGTTPQVLTGPGLALDIGAEMMRMFAMTDDGVLHVSRSHIDHPYVRSFAARLDWMGIAYRLVECDLEAITALYAGATGARRIVGTPAIDPDKLNLMQSVALAFIHDAVRRHASDIHILVDDTYTLVRARVDGDLIPIHRDTAEWGKTLSLAIYQGMTDVSAAHFSPTQPLDAQIRLKVKLPDEIVSIRVATQPRVPNFGMFLRLHWREFADAPSLEALGYFPQQAAIIRALLKRPWGLVMVSGPTGAGKTTSLHVMLAELDQMRAGACNIVTAEDPVELPLRDQVQTSITTLDDEDREQAFLRFARASMRIDPDVFLLGEMRDPASARLAIQAAQTGHLVFTTTHSNNALETISRLANMGIDTAELLDHQILLAIVAQRLIKVLCPYCRIDATRARSDSRFVGLEVDRMATRFGPSVRFVGHGCDTCDGRGTKGRMVVAEVVPFDATLIQVMRDQDAALAECLWRSRGHPSLRDAAMARVREGLVDPFMTELEVNGFDEAPDRVNHAEIDRAREVLNTRHQGEAYGA
ncbi:MAG: Flp pilus assembly complex ATPase component TadA, partial [Betaproteobacteria bacterium]|nr:Flp pilus assembly complex ATPase component TadA [Betaproteobacteria bacterium]